MKSDLHETFRVSSWGSPKMIQHVKNDPILQVPSQEPSTSSKYELQGWGVLDTLLNHARVLKFCTQVKSRNIYEDDN